MLEGCYIHSRYNRHYPHFTPLFGQFFPPLTISLLLLVNWGRSGSIAFWHCGMVSTDHIGSKYWQNEMRTHLYLYFGPNTRSPTSTHMFVFLPTATGTYTRINKYLPFFPSCSLYLLFSSTIYFLLFNLCQGVVNCHIQHKDKLIQHSKFNFPYIYMPPIQPPPPPSPLDHQRRQQPTEDQPLIRTLPQNDIAAVPNASVIEPPTTQQQTQHGWRIWQHPPQYISRSAQPESLGPIVDSNPKRSRTESVDHLQPPPMSSLSATSSSKPGEKAGDKGSSNTPEPPAGPKSTNEKDQDTKQQQKQQQQSQKRRLNQACLLCRRKKIKCDSVQPSCSNCNRRGIQCIYPEVRKRGRPPRSYTFADFAVPGQPLPPELQRLSNVNASAMLSNPGSSSQHSGEGVPGISSILQTINGSATSATSAAAAAAPSHAPSDFGPSPALPPINVAVGGNCGVAVSPNIPPGSSFRGGVRGLGDSVPAPPPVVDQAVVDLFEYIMPDFPIIHRQTLVQNIHDQSLTLPLWLAIHAVTARFEASHGNKVSAQPPQVGSPRGPHGHRPNSTALGAAYAEKAHTLLINRIGIHIRRRAITVDEYQKLKVQDWELDCREVIELLQSHILLSIYYAGNGKLEIAAETHASAARIAQHMGVHLIDDPSGLQEASGIFNMAAARYQRRRAKDTMMTPPLPSATNGMVDDNTTTSAPPPPTPPNTTGSTRISDTKARVSASPTIGNAMEWIEYETLRRLWWSLYILDRMLYQLSGSHRIINISSFRVRLPCSDLEWDSIHAGPGNVRSVATSKPAAATTVDSKPSGLMVRSFNEAVMHASIGDPTKAEISATRSLDPNIYRYSAALTGLLDSVIDLGDDIRNLASPALLDGTDILAQLHTERLENEQQGYVDTLGSGFGPSYPYTNQQQQYVENISSTSIWLGNRRSRNNYLRNSRTGWKSLSTNSTWPPDWRSRMQVLQERATALESKFTEWYSSLPISQCSRKPYLYSQLPLQDRITYFHQQLVYYGGVIQLQSLVIMTQGLLLPTVSDHVDIGTSGSLNLNTLTDVLWRSVMNMDLSQQPQTGNPWQSKQQVDSMYGRHHRPYGAAHSGWATGRQQHKSDNPNHSTFSSLPPIIPLDEHGHSPEVIREELQRMVQAAWRRCTEAAIAMSVAVKRATEMRKVASANPNAPYYDPTFRAQVLPPYRGEVVSGNSVAAGVRASPQQPRTPTMDINMSAGLMPEHLASRRDSQGRRQSVSHNAVPRMPTAQQQQQQESYPPPTYTGNQRQPSRDSATGPGQVVDETAFFMRFNMFTSAAAYIGAYIHLQNMKITPAWQEGIRRHGEAIAKANDMQSSSLSAAVGSGGDLGGGTLPPPLPPALPALPCIPEQAYSSVKPLVKILENACSYWHASSYLDRVCKMWREIVGSELVLHPPPPMQQAAATATETASPSPYTTNSGGSSSNKQQTHVYPAMTSPVSSSSYSRRRSSSPQPAQQQYLPQNHHYHIPQQLPSANTHHRHLSGTAPTMQPFVYQQQQKHQYR